MGTKNNPGQFDCYTAADDEEPLFILRAKDPLAPHFVRMWAWVREGDLLEAQREMYTMLAVDGLRYMSDPEKRQDKLQEARNCADAMEDWRAAK